MPYIVMTKARQVLAKEGTTLYTYIFCLRLSTRTVIIMARALTSLGQPNAYSDRIKTALFVLPRPGVKHTLAAFNELPT